MNGGAPARSERLGWLRGRYSSARALSAGVVLFAVPTIFTVVPSFTEWHWVVRLTVLVVWGATALITVAAASVRDEAIQGLSDDRRAQLRSVRRIAYVEVIESLLRRGAKGIPDHYEFTAYLFDDQQGLLVPIWPRLDFRGERDPRVFAPGAGATGTAWRDERMILVTGSEVANAKYGLTPEQRKYFKGYKVAAAVPILEDATTPFGVLTVLGREDDAFFSGDGPGRSNLLVLADVVGVVLKAIPEPDDLPLGG